MSCRCAPYPCRACDKCGDAHALVRMDVTYIRQRRTLHLAFCERCHRYLTNVGHNALVVQQLKDLGAPLEEATVDDYLKKN